MIVGGLEIDKGARALADPDASLPMLLCRERRQFLLSTHPLFLKAMYTILGKPMILIPNNFPSLPRL